MRDPLQVYVHAQRYTADVLRKLYSTIRVDPPQCVEIPVPGIVTEALFQTVREQLAENRKLARQRRDSAPPRVRKLYLGSNSACRCTSHCARASDWCFGQTMPVKATTVW
ncbi:hypothetical protein J8I82_37455 [Cupriavidus sp. LEh25]|nr:hypothetical protein [Cupriavidus sp. LEh25]